MIDFKLFPKIKISFSRFPSGGSKTRSKQSLRDLVGLVGLGGLGGLGGLRGLRGPEGCGRGVR